jgi:LuxR family maltose regulon positive regulatory protein
MYRPDSDDPNSLSNIVVWSVVEDTQPPELPTFPPVLRSLQSKEGSPSHSTPQPMVEPLTNRELDVLDLLAQRLSNKEIAEKLFLSTTTVKGHLQNIYGKLNVKKRREAVEKARVLGMLKR